MRSTLCFIFLCLIAVLEGRYRCDYTYFDDVEGWLKLHRIPANWREARLRCHLEGGNLASPLNRKFQSAIQILANQKLDIRWAVYTGIHATFSKGDFSSVEGVHLLEIPHTWAPNEPDNYEDTESCIAMLSNGQLADVNCDEPFPYICYKKAPRDVQLNNCGTLDDDYNLDTRTGSCYKFHKEPRTWSRAYMTCMAEGGHLTIVNSDTERTVLIELLAKYPANVVKDVAFIGFHDWGEHGDWLTIDGHTLKDAGYDKFNNGEPNNATTGEFCGAIFRHGTLNDLWCESHNGFICEKRPDSPTCPDKND